ncbi:transposase [Spirosoma agri]
MKERNGRVVAMVVTSTDSRTLQPIIRKHVKIVSNLMTDEFRTYIDANLLYNHQVVKHLEGEYVS